jgi:hypothetical protein
VTVRAFWERWTTDPLFARPKQSSDIRRRELTKAFVDRYGETPLVQSRGGTSISAATSSSTRCVRAKSSTGWPDCGPSRQDLRSSFKSLLDIICSKRLPEVSLSGFWATGGQEPCRELIGASLKGMTG